MREARRHPQHVVVVRGEFRAHPAAEGGGAAPQVHGHIEHGAGHDPHQFALRLGELVMQPAQHMLLGAVLVVLDELQVEARRGELALGPGLEEVAAGILEDLAA